eukprot:tig00001038_g6539.t2
MVAEERASKDCGLWEVEAKTGSHAKRRILEWRLEMNDDHEHGSHGILPLTISQDCSRALCADSMLRVFDLKKGVKIADINLKEALGISASDFTLQSVLFAQCNSLSLTTSDNVLALWDLDRGIMLHHIRLEQNTRIIVSEDCRRVVELECKSLPEGIIKRTDVEQLNAPARLRVHSLVIDAGQLKLTPISEHAIPGAFAPIVYATDHRRTHNYSIVKLSRDGRRAITLHVDRGSGFWFLTLWNAEQWTVIRHMVCPSETFADDRADNGQLQFLTLSEDLSRAVTINKDRTLSMWDLAAGEEEHRLTGHEDDVRVTFFLPGGASFVSAGVQELRLWPLVRRRLRPRASSRASRRARFLRLSADGSRLLHATDTSANLWNTGSGAFIKDIPMFGLCSVDANGRKVIAMLARGHAALAELESQKFEWTAALEGLELMPLGSLRTPAIASEDGKRAIIRTRDGSTLVDLQQGVPLLLLSIVPFKIVAPDADLLNPVFVDYSRAIVNLVWSGEQGGGYRFASAVFALEKHTTIPGLPFQICHIAAIQPFLILASLPGPDGERLLCYSRSGPVESKQSQRRLWLQGAASGKVLGEVEWDPRGPYDPSAELVRDERGERSSRFVLLRSSRALSLSGTMISDWEKGCRVRSSTALVVADVEHGCEAALLASPGEELLLSACARLAPGGQRLRVVASGKGYICVWDVDLAALRSNPVGPLPVLYPARRIADVKRELFNGCLIDGLTSCSPEMRALFLEKGARAAPETDPGAQAEEAADAPVQLALQPWAVVAELEKQAGGAGDRDA